jgi:hypothetical protein
MRKLTKPAPTPETVVEHIRDRLSKQIETSEKYRNRYETENDPEAVVEFIRGHHFALKELWVINAVMAWRQSGQFDLIRRAFLPHKGERPEGFEKASFDFFLTERVDTLIRQGIRTKTAAFEKVKPPNNVYLDPLRIRNIYYATKKKTPQIYIQVNAETLSFMAFPAKVQVDVDGKILTVFGKWEFTIPLKS